jgi:hypothetical protein
MRGQILQAEASGGGTIAGSDGNRYTFSRSDWKGPSDPVAGIEVDFIAGAGTAGEIFPLPGRSAGLGGTAQSYSAASSTASAANTAARPVASTNEGSSVLLGWLGIACLVLSFVIPLLPLVVAFILGLVGASSAKQYRNDTGLTLSRISWIGALVLFVVGVLLVVSLLIFAWPLIYLIWLSIMDEIAKAGVGTSAMLLGLL